MIKEEKIYSRPRIALKSQAVFIFIIAFFTFISLWNFINPIFEALCEDKAKGLATKITNEETTKIINKYNYDTFFTIEKDDKGNVQMITANVLKINQIISDIALEIQKALEKNEKNKIYIAIGSITGVRFLSGIGPKVPLQIVSSGNVDTDLKSEFIAQGVNQTIHRVYLNIKTNLSILTSFNTIDKFIENQILIAENIIVGEIPSTFYNFNSKQGINESDALRIME